MATSALPFPHHPDESLVDFSDNRLLIDLCGEFDHNLAKIEHAFEVQILRRGNVLLLLGEDAARTRAEATLRALYARLEGGRPVEHGDVQAAIHFAGVKSHMDTENGLLAKDDPANDLHADGSKSGFDIKTRKKSVGPRTAMQAQYMRDLLTHELVFGLGPAGTGKTYLAVAVAVSMFIEGRVDRILLSRPAVEAGERLGFLPGDMKDKVDPYMQPLYDALNDFLPARQLGKLIEEKRIEIAPLAFMRGRTLSNAYVVLDEAQNATAIQMKMFLTRLGDGARMAVTGDMSQVDLPRGVPSGLIGAARILRGIDGIAFTHFTTRDVVRHPLVAKIITAYESAGKSDG